MSVSVGLEFGAVQITYDEELKPGDSWNVPVIIFPFVMCHHVSDFAEGLLVHMACVLACGDGPYPNDSGMSPAAIVEARRDVVAGGGWGGALERIVVTVCF